MADKVLLWESGQKVIRDVQPGDVPPAKSVTELDALADAIADAMLEQDTKMKALGLVMADLIEQAFGVSQAVARQQVKTRFRDYYRALLG